MTTIGLLNKRDQLFRGDAPGVVVNVNLTLWLQCDRLNPCQGPNTILDKAQERRLCRNERLIFNDQMAFFRDADGERLNMGACADPMHHGARLKVCNLIFA